MGMRIRLTDEVRYLIRRLTLAGYGAWAVGGCVRDGILGREIHDWDVCTSAKPLEIMRVFEAEKVVPTGLKHGTLTVIIAGAAIETTTLRTDGDYSDHRRPESVRFVDELSLDLARRDFTINAMAYNDEEGLIDIFGGVDDIGGGVIKCVGNARERFGQDALRILRAARFSSQLDFTIEASTGEAAYDMRFDLNYISRERVLAEMVKLLEGKANARAARENAAIISAALGVESIDVSWKRLEADAPVAFALILADKAVNAVRSLKADNRTISRVKSLCEIMDRPVPNTPYQALTLLKDAENDAAVEDLMRVWACRNVKFNEDVIISAMSKCHRVKDLAVNGNDLAAMGYTGKAVADALRALLNLVISGEAENTREALVRISSASRQYPREDAKNDEDMTRRLV
ncbi:MAG: hypothetical protein Q4D04_03500 [Clostridia bacterium]|nr:hypothetical protein [Clostridia bacterium]